MSVSSVDGTLELTKYVAGPGASNPTDTSDLPKIRIVYA